MPLPAEEHIFVSDENVHTSIYIAENLLKIMCVISHFVSGIYLRITEILIYFCALINVNNLKINCILIGG